VIIQDKANVPTAVIIGCCPALAALYRQARNTQNESYDERGYTKQRSRAVSVNAVPLRSGMVSTSQAMNIQTEIYWNEDGHGSQEGLATTSTNI
jgi:hypothetical protein